jgi:hypothetical protein
MGGARIVSERPISTAHQGAEFSGFVRQIVADKLDLRESVVEQWFTTEREAERLSGLHYPR